MMGKNEIILSSRKILVVLGLLGVTSLFADYKLVLTDEAGTQTEECIKSYSFSNNLESIAKQKGVANDVYSDEEVMTNKVYFGKPVYRRIIKATNLRLNAYTHVGYNFNIEKVINSSFIWNPTAGGMSYTQSDTSADYRTMFWATKNGWGYYFGKGRHDVHKWDRNIEFTIEYTKTTDVANTSPNKFQSYIHYKLSSSTNDEVITKDMKNLGVQILEDYTYDSSTSSCTKK